MSNEKYVQYIKEMIDQIESNRELRIIYHVTHRYFIQRGKYHFDGLSTRLVNGSVDTD